MLLDVVGFGCCWMGNIERGKTSVFLGLSKRHGRKLIYLVGIEIENMTGFKDLVNNQLTDKNTLHSYLDLYQSLLEEKKGYRDAYFRSGNPGRRKHPIMERLFPRSDDLRT